MEFNTILAVCGSKTSVVIPLDEVSRKLTQKSNALRWLYATVTGRTVEDLNVENAFKALAREIGTRGRNTPSEFTLEIITESGDKDMVTVKGERGRSLLRIAGMDETFLVFDTHSTVKIKEGVDALSFVAAEFEQEKPTATEVRKTLLRAAFVLADGGRDDDVRERLETILEQTLPQGVPLIFNGKPDRKLTKHLDLLKEGTDEAEGLDIETDEVRTGKVLQFALPKRPDNVFRALDLERASVIDHV